MADDGDEEEKVYGLEDDSMFGVVGNNNHREDADEDEEPEGSDFGIGFGDGGGGGIGGDGEGGGNDEVGGIFADMSLLEFSESHEERSIKTVPEREHKELQWAFDESRGEVKDLQTRLKRRTKLVEDIRTAYLRDVVTIKHVLNDVLAHSEKKQVLEEYKARLPSVDLRQALSLYGPQNAHMKVKGCETCGGHVDIVINDSALVEQLKTLVDKYKDREERLRVTIAMQDQQLENSKEANNAALRSHNEEKRYLYEEMKKLKQTGEKNVAEIARLGEVGKKQRDHIHALKQDIAVLEEKRRRLESVEKEMTELKQNLADTMGQLYRSEAEGVEKSNMLQSNSERIANLLSTISDHESTIKSLNLELKEMTVQMGKFRDMSVFLEKCLEEKSQLCSEQEGKIMDLTDELKNQGEDLGLELATVTNEKDSLAGELAGTREELREAQNSIEALQAIVRGDNETMESQRNTISIRDEELADAAAEIEGLEEELAAMKQFLSDTVAARKTPSRNRRRLRRKEAGGGDGDGEEDEDDEEGLGFGDDDDDEEQQDADDVVISGDPDDWAPPEEGAQVSSPPFSSRPESSESRSRPASSQSSLERKKRKTVRDRPAPALSERSQRLSKEKTVSIARESEQEADEDDDDEEEEEEKDEDEEEGQEEHEGKAEEHKGGGGGGEGGKESEQKEAEPPSSAAKKQSPTPKPRVDASSPPPPDPEVAGKEKEEVKSAAAAETQSKPSLSKSGTTSAAASASAEVAFASVAGTEYSPSTQTHRPKREKAPRGTTGGGEDRVENRSDSQREYNAPTVAPPTSGAKPKVKAKTAGGRGETKEKNVVLLGPTNEATQGEMLLREAFLKAAQPPLGTNGANKALNAARDTFAEFGKLMSNACTLLWQALLLSKRGLDCQSKVNLITDGIILCTEKDTTNEKIGKVVAQIVPLAGSSLGLTITHNWADLCDLNEDLLENILPSVNPETGETLYKPYEAFFGSSGGDHTYALVSCRKNLASLTKYFDEQQGLLNTKLVNVLRDWCDAKGISVDLDARIAAERAAVKREMQIEVAAVTKELAMSNGRYDAAREFSKTMEAKLDTCTKRVIELTPYPEKFRQALLELEGMKRQQVEETKQLTELQESFTTLQNDKEEADRQVASLTKLLGQTVEAMKIEAVKALDFEMESKSFEASAQEYRNSLEEVVTYHEKRKSEAKDVACQGDSICEERGTQTEFFSAPMTLRTIVARGQGKYARRPFAVSLVAPPLNVDDNGDLLSNAPFSAAMHELHMHSRRGRRGGGGAGGTGGGLGAGEGGMDDDYFGVGSGTEIFAHRPKSQGSVGSDFDWSKFSANAKEQQHASTGGVRVDEFGFDLSDDITEGGMLHQHQQHNSQLSRSPLRGKSRSGVVSPLSRAQSPHTHIPSPSPSREGRSRGGGGGSRGHSGGGGGGGEGGGDNAMQFEPTGGVSGLYEDEISKRLLQLEVASGGGSGGEGGVVIAGGLGRRMSEDSLLSLASLDRSLTKSLSQQQRQQQQQQPYGSSSSSSPQDMLDSFKKQFPVKAGLQGKGVGGSEWVGGPPLVMTRKGKALLKGSSLESASGSTQSIGVGGSGLVVGGKTSKASGQGKVLTTSASLASLQKQYFSGGGGGSNNNNVRV